MAFKVVFEDITNIETDCIVNSIGVNGKVYGQLCQMIIQSSKSQDIKNKIDSLENGNIGDIIVTNGGAIKAKHILHIVSPFKRDDNKDNQNLYKAYKSLVELSIQLGYKSLVVPFLGTGANGYEDNDAYNAVKTVAAELLQEEENAKKDILDLNLAIFTSNIRRNSEQSYCRRIDNVAIDGEVKTVYKNVKAISKLMGCIEYEEDDMLMLPFCNYKKPFDFVVDWFYQKNMSESVLVGKLLLTKARKMSIKRKKTLEKFEIYAIANEVGMSKFEVVKLMMINNTCFDPMDKMDMFEVNYLLGKYGKMNKLEYSNFSYEKCGVWISLSNEDYYKKKNQTEKDDIE